MGVSKVDFAGNTLVDLTGDSVTPETLLEGATAHNAAGDQIDGAVAVAPASTTTPKAPGTASAGSESAYARGDHVHPHDGTKINNPTEKADGQVLTYDAASGMWMAKETAGGKQIYVTEYFGTGTSGSNNPTSVTFDFVPTMVFIMPLTTTEYSYSVATFVPGLQRVNWLINQMGGWHFTRAKVTWSEDLKTMSWYAESTHKLQNSSTASSVFIPTSPNNTFLALLQLNAVDATTGPIPYRVIALRSE